MIIWIQHTMHKRIKINLRECLHNRGIKSSMDPLPSETTITGENYVKRQLKKNIRKNVLRIWIWETFIQQKLINLNKNSESMWHLNHDPLPSTQLSLMEALLQACAIKNPCLSASQILIQDYSFFPREQVTSIPRLAPLSVVKGLFQARTGKWTGLPSLRPLS